MPRCPCRNGSIGLQTRNAVISHGRLIETIVRIAIAVLSVFGGAGIAVYIAGWLLMPTEGSDRSIANKLTRTARHGTQS